MEKEIYVQFRTFIKGNVSPGVVSSVIRTEEANHGKTLPLIYVLRYT